MNEQEWLACGDPYAVLDYLRATASVRKLRLAAVALYRWPISTIIGTPWGTGSVYSLSNELLELAEALADGKVSFDDAQYGRIGRDGELMALISESPIIDIERVFWKADDIADYYADLLLTYCCDCAWQIAKPVAWGYWQDTVKDHPWLSSFDRVEEDLAKERERLQGQAWDYFLNIHYRKGSIDYWDYAKNYFGAYETPRTATWDALWAEAWERGWRECWAGMCPPGSELLQQVTAADWKRFSDRARNEAWDVGPWDEVPPGTDFESFVGFRELSCEVKDFIHVAEPGRQAAMLREIFGNPFRPVTLEPRWLTSTVVDLAEAIYEEHALDRMPILADALMDAGCDSEEIINHCRGNEPHVRGCWVLDLVLGRS